MVFSDNRREEGKRLYQVEYSVVYSIVVRGRGKGRGKGRGRENVEPKK